MDVVLGPQRARPGRALTDTPYLRLQGLVKQFPGRLAVDQFSLDVARGEIVALLGPSGCGKTTTLRLLAGFETPDAGTITVEGEDVTRVVPERRRFGMVFQNYALFPHLTVGENVAFGLALKGAAAAKRVASVLAMVDLAGYEDRAITALSGGQQQRVAVARSLAPEPRVLLLDEPLSNLDPSLRERTRKELREAIQRVGITTVFVTHEQEEAFDLGDRIAVMNSGKLEQVGTADVLYDQPASAFVATFVGRSNVIPAELLGEAKGLRAYIRPEALRPSTDGRLAGTVTARRFAGGFAYFTVALKDGPSVEVYAHHSALAVGDEVKLAVERVTLLDAWRQSEDVGRLTADAIRMASGKSKA